MSVKQLDIKDFLYLSKEIPIIDVRSPQEFSNGHIPNAHSIPIFSNKERAEIGTVYKQIGVDEAIELGTEFANLKHQYYLQNISQITQKNALIHCWRGGLRSRKIAEFYISHGFDVQTLIGGYKEYRRYIRKEFLRSQKIFLIGGYTGTGKTKIIHELDSKGFNTIDLEQIASHKGSMFGHLGENSQPSTEQFENNLYEKWSQIPENSNIFIEHESKRVGDVYLPDTFYQQLLNSTLLKIRIPEIERIKNLVEEYGSYGNEKLINIFTRLAVHMGDAASKKAVKAIQSNDLYSATQLALAYYDKVYDNALKKHPVAKVVILDFTNTPKNDYTNQIIEFVNQSNR